MPYELLTASGLEYVQVTATGEVLRYSPGAPAALGVPDGDSDPRASLVSSQRLQSLQSRAMVLALQDSTTLYVLRGVALRDQNSEELHRHNRRLRDTLDAIDATVVVYDRDRRYVLGNHAYHTMFPHLPPDDEMIGRRYEDILARSIEAGTVADSEAYNDTVGFIARRAEEITREDTSPREVYNRATNRWFMIRVSRTPDGSRVALRVDITAQKQLQTELAEAHHAAEAASRAKSQFLANVSHELRTPLNAVINFAQLIAEELHGPAGNPKYVEYAETIRSSGQYLLALFNDLLDLARADSDRLTLARQPVNLRSQIALVCRMMRAEAQSAQVNLTTNVLPQLPSVVGDSTRLRQVLVNLISNAIKFTEPNGSVRVIAAEVDDWIEITVADTGCGIDPADMERVLLPFEQVVDPTRRLNPGAGLGLPLSKHLVELHGGSLRLQSTPMKGTTVVVRLHVAGVPSAEEATRSRHDTRASN
jgi:two-component system cell cycle sensor histidine kinase PleC